MTDPTGWGTASGTAEVSTSLLPEEKWKHEARGKKIKKYSNFQSILSPTFQIPVGHSSARHRDRQLDQGCPNRANSFRNAHRFINGRSKQTERGGEGCSLVSLCVRLSRSHPPRDGRSPPQIHSGVAAPALPRGPCPTVAGRCPAGLARTRTGVVVLRGPKTRLNSQASANELQPSRSRERANGRGRRPAPGPARPPDTNLADLLLGGGQGASAQGAPFQPPSHPTSRGDPLDGLKAVETAGLE